jgi:hypothetical protein
MRLLFKPCDTCGVQGGPLASLLEQPKGNTQDAATKGAHAWLCFLKAEKISNNERYVR